MGYPTGQPLICGAYWASMVFHHMVYPMEYRMVRPRRIPLSDSSITCHMLCSMPRPMEYLIAYSMVPWCISYIYPWDIIHIHGRYTPYRLLAHAMRHPISWDTPRDKCSMECPVGLHDLSLWSASWRIAWSISAVTHHMLCLTVRPMEYHILVFYGKETANTP